jgi:hypothetical protein
LAFFAGRTSGFPAPRQPVTKRSRDFLNHLEKLVLERKAFDLAFMGVVIGRSLDLFLDAMDLLVGLVVFLKEAGKMSIGHLELMDFFPVLREFVNQVVLFNGHFIVSIGYEGEGNNSLSIPLRSKADFLRISCRSSTKRNDGHGAIVFTKGESRIEAS